MDDLTPRLAALLRRYAAAFDQPPDDQLGERFRKDMELLIAEYGPQAVNAALNKLPDGALPSIALH